MRMSELNEWGRIVKDINTTVDVDTDEIKVQAAKYGNTVDKDGFPPTMTTVVKPKSTNVKHHSPVKESEEPRYTAAEWAIISGGHTLEETVVEPKKPGMLYTALTEGYKLQLERDKDVLVLHIKDNATGKRTEVRGKPGYETNGYDPKDRLHQLLDVVGKSANISELMNGEVVTINPKHPDAKQALSATDRAYNESLDNPYPIRWSVKNDNEWYGHAKEDDFHNQIGIQINDKHNSGRWTIRFKVGDKMDKTGEGDQFRIFATVSKAIKEWWNWASKNAEVNQITFSAEKILDSSRSKLYNRFAKQFANAIGYNFEVVSGRASDIFYLKKPGVEEARSFQPQQSPLQELVKEYLFFTSMGQMGTQDGAKSTDSKDKINEVLRTLAQSNKNLQNLDKQTLEKNRDKIFNHIHDTMKYAIAHFREHLRPEYFDTKKKQINSVLTKYNAAASTNENFAESKVNYKTPNFEYEWEEAERYPEFKKIGKDAWIELAGKGKAVTIRSAKDINNTDAAEPDSFASLDKTKQGRALDQLKSGTVEMPIVAVYSDGWKELVGGNTRLTAMLAQNGKATIWVFKVPDEVAELAENFADGKKPGRKGLAKRSGVNTKASVSSLRKTAKNSSGEKQRMAHWLANMKAGKAKKK